MQYGHSKTWHNSCSAVFPACLGEWGADSALGCSEGCPAATHCRGETIHNFSAQMLFSVVITSTDNCLEFSNNPATLSVCFYSSCLVSLSCESWKISMQSAWRCFMKLRKSWRTWEIKLCPSAHRGVSILWVCSQWWATFINMSGCYKDPFHILAFLFQDSLAAEIEGTMRKELQMDDPDVEEQRYHQLM